MRKIIVLEFISLDGVMQAPGGVDEDKGGDFRYGGWTVPYFDEFSGMEMDKQMKPADLLLGRKTFDIFESYWPSHESNWPGINKVTKYVVSRTRTESKWETSVFYQKVDDVAKLKKEEGRDLQVYGSSQLVQSLLVQDLVDELWLKIFPVTLGRGKRLFNEEIPAAAYKLTYSKTSPSGVVFANYRRVGEVQTGSFE